MMELWIWDVQHGSAAYLKTPTGRHVVVDLGIGDITKGDSAFSPLRHLRWNMGVRVIDELFITHPHRDHLDDIWELSQFDELRIFRRPRHLSAEDVRAGNRARPGDQRVVERYLELHAEYTAQVSPLRNLNLPSNTGMEIESFIPSGCSRDNLNNHSILSFFTHRGWTICFPGDNEAASWRELLAFPRVQTLLQQTSVFVAAHHGREAGYCADVFGYCSPKLVLVSDGPASDTSAIAKYSSQASGWLVHSRCGAPSITRKVLTTRSDGTIRVLVYEGGGLRHLDVSVE